jgi:hypothetical protein
MNLNSLGSLLPAVCAARGLESVSSVSSAATGIEKGACGGGLASELVAGLSDDASSANMLSSLASTFGAAGSGVSVPQPAASSPQFRSYESLQQTQGGNSDAVLFASIGNAADGESA